MHRVRTLFKALIFLASFPAAADMQASSPTEVVENFQSSLLQVMKEADQLTVQQRYDRLFPAIREAYQTQLMIRIVAGPFWSQATAEQKRRMHDAFVRMGASTLATLFSGYSGEVFRIVSERPGPQKTTIVATRIERQKKEPVPINYVTRNDNGRWYIVDILLNNEISELKVRQSEYQAILAKDGIESLITVLDAKANELVADTKSPN